jgi:hypothetical protein
VLRAWNDEYGQAVENAKRITDEIDYYRNLRKSTYEKYIVDKITEEHKNAQIVTIKQKIEDIEDERIEASAYVKEKERLVDVAMSLI